MLLSMLNYREVKSYFKSGGTVYGLSIKESLPRSHVWKFCLAHGIDPRSPKKLAPKILKFTLNAERQEYELLKTRLAAGDTLPEMCAFLDVSRATVYSRCKKWGLDPKQGLKVRGSAEFIFAMLKSNTKINERGCWVLQKFVAPGDGYGHVFYQGRTQPAHRVAFIASGRVPGDMVRHTCDNRACVNPEHLLNGTHYDNMMDMQVRNPKVLHKKPLPATKRVEIFDEHATGLFSYSTLANRHGINLCSAQRYIKVVGTLLRQIETKTMPIEVSKIQREIADVLIARKVIARGTKPLDAKP